MAKIYSSAFCGPLCRLSDPITDRGRCHRDANESSMAGRRR